MKKLLIAMALPAMLGQPLFAQSLKKKGDEQYLLYNYAKAVPYYKDAFKDKEGYYYAHQLGNCYRLMHDFKFAESWFAEALKFPEKTSEDYLYYAEALRNNAKYAEAVTAYKQYADQTNQSVDARRLWIGSCDSAVVWQNHPEPYMISSVNRLNSPGSDYGMVPYGDKWLFSSDDKNRAQVKESNPVLRLDIAKDQISKDVYGWTGRGYLNIFAFNPKDSSIAPLFNDEDKRTYHIGSPSFTKNGNEVFYTVTRMVKNPKNSFLKNEAYTVKLEIYSRKLSGDGQWSAPVAFQYNKPMEYSVGDPFITPNGQYLYFSSDMPGGMGGTDLYYCKRNVDGSWDVPQNLGVMINTTGNERFPSFSADDTFYFSSDGRVGMGGLDIYMAKTTDKGFQRPQSLKYPINSAQDDFAIYFINGDQGYLSSNRDGGKGDDDIYTFRLKQDIIVVKGIVTDKITGKPLENAVLSFTNVKTGEITKVTTDADGNYKAELNKFSTYNVLADKSDYIAQSDKGTPVSLDGRKWMLDQIHKNVGIRIENIYYNFDKWDLRKDALVELDKLVQVLKDNPTMEIELGSHTDSRGKDDYNMKLSQKRAQSVVDYLISKGIDKSRLTAKGYGETQPVNQCTNGAKCTEAEFQLNRRTEFKITRY